MAIKTSTKEENSLNPKEEKKKKRQEQRDEEIKSRPPYWLLCPLCIKDCETPEIPYIRLYMIEDTPMVDITCHLKDKKFTSEKLEKFIEILQKERNTVLERKKDFYAYCLDGDEWLTEEENKVHEIMNFRYKHLLSEIPVNISSICGYCDEFEQVKFFCCQCSAPMCKKCKIDQENKPEHKNHSIQKLKELLPIGNLEKKFKSIIKSKEKFNVYLNSKGNKMLIDFIETLFKMLEFTSKDHLPCYILYKILSDIRYNPSISENSAYLLDPKFNSQFFYNYFKVNVEGTEIKGLHPLPEDKILILKNLDITTSHQEKQQIEKDENGYKAIRKNPEDILIERIIISSICKNNTIILITKYNNIDEYYLEVFLSFNLKEPIKKSQDNSLKDSVMAFTDIKDTFLVGGRELKIYTIKTLNYPTAFQVDNQIQSITCILHLFFDIKKYEMRFLRQIPNDSDGNIIITGSSNGVIAFFDMKKKECINMQRYNSRINCICKIKEGEFAIGLEDGSVITFKDSQKILKTGESVTQLLVLPNKEEMLSGGKAGLVILWDLKSYEILWSFTQTEETILYLIPFSCSFSKNGFVVGSNKNIVTYYSNYADSMMLDSEIQQKEEEENKKDIEIVKDIKKNDEEEKKEEEEKFDKFLD